VPAILLMGDRAVGTPLIEWLRRVDPRLIKDLPSALSTCEWLGQVRRLQAGFQQLSIAPKMTNGSAHHAIAPGSGPSGNPVAKPFYLY
jgi:DNA mismatch repair protein MutH